MSMGFTASKMLSGCGHPKSSMKQAGLVLLLLLVVVVLVVVVILMVAIF